MCHTVTAATSPLNCHWIQPGSRGAIEGLEYAVCERLADAPRVVNEVECAHCPLWEPPRRQVAACDGDLQQARAACDTLPA